MTSVHWNSQESTGNRRPSSYLWEFQPLLHTPHIYNSRNDVKRSSDQLTLTMYDDTMEPTSFHHPGQEASAFVKPSVWLSQWLSFKPKLREQNSFRCSDSRKLRTYPTVQMNSEIPRYVQKMVQLRSITCNLIWKFYIDDGFEPTS